MMNRKTLILLICAILGAMTACSDKNKVPQPAGSVTITFSTGGPETRAGNGDATDGGGIVVDGSGNPDLYIAIANYQGSIIATYTGSDTAVAELESSTSTTASIRFKTITNSGDYTVYALANATGDEWGAPSSASAWNAITTASAMDALTFTALAGAYTLHDYTDANSRMPISAKGTLSISEGLNGHLELEMKRCVGKVGFKFKNETGASLSLTDCRVTLEDINPTNGYLFPRASDATGTPRDLVLNMGDFVIPTDSYSDIYCLRLVFPSLAPERAVGSRYFCNIEFAANGGSTQTFEELPIHDKHSSDITALGRNQYLMVETRINKGYNISFNFEVLDWDHTDEEITFH